MDPKLILECYGKEFEEGNFSDFTVLVERTRFKCHRFVLSACSGFFKGLLRSDMAETRNNEVTLRHIASGIFALILEVLYKGTEVLTEENMLELWQAANQLQIIFLIQDCEKYIIRHISPVNVLQIHQVAILLDSKKVLEAAREALVKNFTTVSQNEMFLELAHQELFEILKKVNARAKMSNQIQNDRPHQQYHSNTMAALLGWQEYQRRLCQAGLINQVLIDQAVKSVLSWVTHGYKNRTVGDKSNTRVPYLKMLLEAAGIAKASSQCMKALMSNDIVMNCKDARDIVLGVCMTRLG